MKPEAAAAELRALVAETGGERSGLRGRHSFSQPGARDPFGKVYRGEVVVIVGTTLIRVFGNGEIAGGELVEMVNTIDVSQPLTAT